MIAVLKQRNFSLLWLGGLVSMIGNWVLLAAMPFHIYALTGSALATGGLLMAYVAPGIVVGSIAGVYVDRWDRKRTMLITTILQGAMVATLLFVQSADWLWLIYLVAIVESTLERFFRPAENALLPKLVGEDQLLSANSLNALNDNLARLGGPALGGLLLGLVGFYSVVVVDVATYVVAAFLILLVQLPESARRAEVVPTESADVGGAFRSLWTEWKAGLAIVGHSRLLIALFVVLGLMLFGDAILSAVLVVFVQEDMGLTAVEFGWMMTARGIGGIIGGLLAAQLGAKLMPGRLLAVGLTATGVALVVAVFFPTLTVVLPLLIFVGIMGLIAMISAQTMMQKGTEDAYLGRVFGLFGAVSALVMFIGAGIGGALADTLGSLTLMYGAAILTIASGLLAFILLGRSAPQLAAPAAAPAPEAAETV